MIVTNLLLMVLGLLILPLALIWALNTLFSLKLAYSFKTWLAMVVLLFVITGRWHLPFYSGDRSMGLPYYGESSETYYSSNHSS